MTAQNASQNWFSLSDSTVLDSAELQLQQELREMFLVDTQQYLETYFTLVQQLTPLSWKDNIQHIYRAVHTIKGGAVTVDADAMLHAAIVLEDLLSDLRYLEDSPDLEDGQLSQMLLEAGDLLSSSLNIQETGDAAIAAVQPTVQRIQILHELIKQRFLPDWNELRQVHQEFAEQGLDLLGLNLEMALGSLDPSEDVPDRVRQIAHEFLSQLDRIGQELQMESGWSMVLQQGSILAEQANGTVLKQEWSGYLQILKDCAKDSGQCSADLQAQLAQMESRLTGPTSDATDLAGSTSHVSTDLLVDADPLGVEDLDSIPSEELDIDLSDLECLSLEIDPLLEDCEPLVDFTLEPIALSDTIDLSGLTSDLLDETRFDVLDIPENFLEEDFADFSEFIALPDLDGIDNLTFEDSLTFEESLTFEDDPTFENAPAFEDVPIIEDSLTVENAPIIEEEVLPILADIALPQDSDIAPGTVLLDNTLSTDPSVEENQETIRDVDQITANRSIQVPVPLQRLDKSAHQVTETLLSARATTSTSQTLHGQIVRLTALTQESSQFVARLRQLQDDYAFMRTSHEQTSDNALPLERYRQGYATLNRLLENMLRMSELGQEIEMVTQQSLERLDQLNQNIGHLKNNIEDSRLVPFRQLSLRIRAIVRDLANRYEKPAELAILGEQVELDAAIVSQLEPALLHLIRNAYDHGLEPLEARLAAGKPMQGTLTLSLTRLGNRYRLTLQDDGGGIDAEAIRQRALAKGFPLTQTHTPEQLLAVLCQPGFSSRTTISEVSGRGVGMDVVASQIARLGGKLKLATKMGQGTTFTLELPAPQLLVPCVLFQVGDRTLAIPAEEILETTLLSTVEAKWATTNHAQCNWTIETAGRVKTGFDLRHYWSPWQLPTETTRVLPDTAIGIRTRTQNDDGLSTDGDAGIWFIADDLIGQQELLISPLPKPLVPPVGLLGVSLQPDGGLLTVLDPLALLDSLQASPTPSPDGTVASSAPQMEAAPATTILIVDDAALMRRRLQGSLVAYGYSTQTCTDGLEAWNWLSTHPLPDVLITDVEMPNMDGFTLIDRCRQAGMNMPILVVSSRLSEDWGKEARRLGANDYLNKGFATAELIQKVNQVLGRTAALAESH
ncbi:MAG: response regulator [Thermosynechococcaceae cyanobacterium]